MKVKFFTRNKEGLFMPMYAEMAEEKILSIKAMYPLSVNPQDFLKSEVRIDFTKIKPYTRYIIYRCSNEYLLTNYQEDGSVDSTPFFNLYYILLNTLIDHHIVIWKTEADEIFVLAKYLIASDTLPFEERNFPFSRIVSLESKDPKAYDEYVKADMDFQGRLKLEKFLRPSSSLSYMDVQVDALLQLAKIIIMVFPSVANKIQEINPSLPYIFDEGNNYSILNLKNVDQCLATLERKKKARELQEQYYKTLSSNIGDPEFEKYEEEFPLPVELKGTPVIATENVVESASDCVTTDTSKEETSITEDVTNETNSVS